MIKSFVCLLCFLCLALPGRAQPTSFSWDRATAYYVVIDRFQNSDPANDHAYGRGFDATGTPYTPDPAGHFYGGDFAGLTRRIEAGYFDDLGIDVLLLSAPFEQVHGWRGTGPEGMTQEYAFHGRWPLDFTEPDAALGTAETFAALIQTAHAHGLRVALDVALSHGGAPTLQDMATFGFGALKGDGWQRGRPGPDESWRDYAGRFLDRTDADSLWARWWGPGWVRADLPGYDACGEDDATRCLDGQPDFKTEATTPVSLPAFLREKWGPQKLAREEAALDAFFARTGYPRTPRYYLIKWLCDWVETYGIDGFHIGDARYVEPGTWAPLRNEAVRALRAWKTAHPALDDLDFWMAGAGPDFDATPAAFRDLTAPFDSLDARYAAYAERAGGRISYLPSGAATTPAQRFEAGTRLLLLPGTVRLTYGDETARPDTSPMNWETADAAVRAHWQTLGQFRRRHPAISGGRHRKLGDAPYVFHRSAQVGRTMDDVIVVLGAEGRTRLNVSHVFPDDTVLRDACSGHIAIVSYGLISFPAGPLGVLLLEEVP